MLPLSELEPQKFTLQLREMKNVCIGSSGSAKLMIRKPSRDPEAHRPYIPGDPTQRIDWRAFARTDTLLIRQAAEATVAVVEVVIDLAESMFWPDVTIQQKVSRSLPSKAELAHRLGFFIAAWHLSLGDRVSIVFWDSSGIYNCTFQSLKKLQETFQDIRAANFVLSEHAKPLVESSQKQSIDCYYYCGDCLSEDSLPLVLTRKAKQKFLLHILSSLELDADWLRSDAIYVDRAASDKELSADSLKLRYNARISEWTQGIEQAILADGVYYCFSENSDMEPWLAQMQGRLRS